MEFTNFHGRQQPQFGSVNSISEEQEELWLTVREASAHAILLGLNRTPKTIGEWARKSYEEPGRGVVTSRKQDTDNGFRYVISKSSLELKIKEELDLEANSNASTPVYTGEHTSTPVNTGVHTSTPVKTGEDVGNKKTNHSQLEEALVDKYERIIEEKDNLIAALQDHNKVITEELVDRRDLAGALKDVITAFKLNAETQAHLSLGSRPVDTEHEATDPLWPGDEIKT